jgi:hypothetical protein
LVGHVPYCGRPGFIPCPDERRGAAGVVVMRWEEQRIPPLRRSHLREMAPVGMDEGVREVVSDVVVMHAELQVLRFAQDDSSSRMKWLLRDAGATGAWVLGWARQLIVYLW